MENLLKKILYTSVGFVSTTAEKVQKNIDELVQKGKLTEEEGKKVVDDLLEDTETMRTDWENKIQALLESAKTRLQPAKKEKAKDLLQRIEELEAKLKEKEGK